MQGLCGVLEVNDSGVVETVLDSLEAILKAAGGELLRGSNLPVVLGSP